MNVLTFDIEEWFHCDLLSGSGKWDSYERRMDFMTDKILGLLEKKEQKATFYVLGWAARRFPEVVRRIRDSGHEIGCHSDMHEMVFKLGRETFAEDTRRALGTLEDILSEKVEHYRAPAFSITEETPWAFDILLENGITTDSSIFPATRDYGGYPGIGTDDPLLLRVGDGVLREFPINIISLAGRPLVFSGGGYFRLFPYPLIARWTRRSPYVMSYFHPRDFDAEQPVLKHLPLHRRFKSYYGLRGAWEKLGRWLDAFEWISVGQAIDIVDWEKAGEVKIVQNPES